MMEIIKFFMESYETNYDNNSFVRVEIRSSRLETFSHTEVFWSPYNSPACWFERRYTRAQTENTASPLH